MSAPIMSRFDLFYVVLDECEENSDRKIAEHIVRVHQKKDLALTPPYSATQIQRYIKFARCIDPRLTPDAKKVLVEQYKKLRQADSSGGGRSCYRITVRQLESIVRLSEALARLHCEDEVTPDNVYEAVRLLKTSIINVESTDLRMSQSGKSNTENDTDETMSEVDQTTIVKTSEYENICRLLLLRIDQFSEGVVQQQLCDWYINAHDHVDSQSELIDRQKVIHSVIQHMVEVDKSLVEIANPNSDLTTRVLMKNCHL
jgi:DNA replication licensing factor MCM6